VGCKIKGVRRILEAAGDFGVLVDDGDKRLSLFFFVGALGAAKAEGERAERYRELHQVVGDMPIPDEALQAAGRSAR
jgi:hypothetical protein